MKRLAIIVDLDGTLCNTTHRQHHMEGEKKNWKAFYESLKDDPINEWCRKIIVQFIYDHDVIFVSGRPDTYKKETLVWLSDYFGGYNTQLLMRKENDFRKDSIVKKEIYDEQIKPHYDVLFCIDDRQQVVDMWREQGLVCLQCAKGDF